MSSTTTTKTYSKSDYLQPSSSNSYDSSQSPLALLAQTCSSIGKDSPSSPSSIVNSIPPTITSLSTKSSSNLLNTDKSFSSTKRSSPSQLNNINTRKKSALPLKTNIQSTSSSFIEPNLLSNHLTPLYDPNKSVATLLLRSSLAYLASQQHSYSSICTIPGCLQCETVRYILSNSINNQPYICHWSSCNARFYSNDELSEHIRYSHRTSKISHYHHHHRHHRFHPYLNTSRIIEANDQLPFFYPHLSLLPMTETKLRTNNNTNNNN
ncbi:unnamed protein product [Rotaria sordida]|uniref:C2H2-type domain-containing protein n=1 Tax=Rotaria sordida TaxID=392033 RepID=A0A814P0A1_9BILA|nr:unnamed protein product [Rotaria sordida]CAF1152520.1 unnamed protein product [Rotaria sordida]CAF3701113.1 unnamed protein product [Rotaria sordida]CAF3869827.1 unnamed protein product [Rotaria sordida]